MAYTAHESFVREGIGAHDVEPDDTSWVRGDEVGMEFFAVEDVVVARSLLCLHEALREGVLEGGEVLRGA